MALSMGLLGASLAGAAGAYELIESNILTSSASSVTFSSIPQDYKHLQIRAVLRSDRASTTDLLKVVANSDTGTNYSQHFLRGNGSSVSSSYRISETYALRNIFAGGNATSGNFTAFTADVLDYNSTFKNSTFRSLSGFIGPGAGEADLGLYSTAWLNTGGITSLSLSSLYSTNLVAGSRFSLYGIRG